MARTVIVGDVHGCRSELERLLSRIGISGTDRLVFVGDLVGRGPDTLGVLKLARKLDATVVRGNHEQKLLAFRSWIAKGLREPPPAGRSLRELSAKIGEGTWRWLADLPLWLDIPEHGLRVVHAGVVPSRPLEETDPNVLMTIRGLSEEGDPTASRASRLWGEIYQGPPHIVFGHNAWIAPQIHTWATGLDTGCVYGGALTALVLLPGEPVPPPERRMAALVSVPSARPYFRIRRDP